MRTKPYSLAFIAFALLSVVASDALAQEEGRRGRRGGFGAGPGGRGGDPTMGLLRIEAVKAELEITEEQQTALDKLAEQSRSERGRPQGANFREMSETERGEFLEQMRKDFADRAKAVKEKLEEVLLPGQMERLEQLSLQIRGVGAIDDPAVRAELEISEEQIAKLAAIRESSQVEMRTKMQELFQAGDREAMRTAFTDLRKNVEENLLGVLTDQQRAEFEEMKGEPFEFPEDALGRGGRRPGDRGPGGRAAGRRPGGAESDTESP